jgi:4-amino-4-deoxy-L-arabinose transferase-like glycosyltransferase
VIWLFMAMVLAAGTFLRLWQINALGYNSDEAVYAGQAAAIVRDPVLREIFPIFRAHPLLFQFLVALAFTFGVSDVVGRLVSVAVGIATVYLVYRLGSLVYGQRAGLFAALFLALMPYHVVATRQVLLDGAMAFFATLTLYLMARFAATQRPAWLYAAGAGMGLTFLAKETGIVLVGSVYAFLALAPNIRVRIRDLALSMICMALVIAPFPLTLMLAGGGGSKKTQQYLVWQLFRRPNHEWSFYPTTVPVAIGLLVILAAILGLWLLRREWSWRETLLIAWVLVPVTFFQLWPTKGFQYLLPIASPVVILAGRTLDRWPARVGQLTWLRSLAAGGIALTLLISSWGRVQPVTSDEFLAGSGGVPGGREVGEWIRQNTPEGAVLMTVGPSMANIIQFYGHRRAYGLSVSPNPLHRNPSYQPIENPDYQLRNGDLQYIVWDSFSAARTPFFSQKLLSYAERYHGRVVHTISITVTTPDGETAVKPVIIIYEVRP